MVDNKNPNDAATMSKAGSQGRSKIGLPDRLKIGLPDRLKIGLPDRLKFGAFSTQQAQQGGMKNPPISVIPVQDMLPDARYDDRDETKEQLDGSHPMLTAARQDPSNR